MEWGSLAPRQQNLLCSGVFWPELSYRAGVTKSTFLEPEPQRTRICDSFHPKMSARILNAVKRACEQAGSEDTRYAFGHLNLPQTISTESGSSSVGERVTQRASHKKHIRIQGPPALLLAHRPCCCSYL